MPWTEQLANLNDLRRCVRDLVALSALPAGWQNYDMRQIGSSIVAALTSMLPISSSLHFLARAISTSPN
jgi:hypothetical protein